MNKKPVVDVIIKLRNLRLTLDVAILTEQPLATIKEIHLSIQEKEGFIKDWEKSPTGFYN